MVQSETWARGAVEAENRRNLAWGRKVTAKLCFKGGVGVIWEVRQVEGAVTFTRAGSWSVAPPGLHYTLFSLLFNFFN